MEEKISSNTELSAKLKTNEQKKSLGFKPNLMSLSSFINRAMDEPVNLDKLYTEISIGTSANFQEEIYAIIPYEKENAYTFIIYRDTAKLVELGTDVIAANFLYHYWKMGLVEYRQTVEEFLGSSFHSIPLSCENFSLMPFSISTSPKRDIWINPGRIKELKIVTDQKTIVSLFNDFVFYLDRKGKAIYDQMYRSFLVHGIVKRYVGYMPVGWGMGLLEYLNVSSSCPIRKAINGLDFLDIPGYGKDFFGKIVEYHDNCVSGKTQQHIFTSLNISE